jgi:pSer/pThr/pTyr-binding forkhead associated (FHA) protein
MPFLQLSDSRYPLHNGANRIGRGAGIEVQLPEAGAGVGDSVGTAATVQIAVGSASISGASGAVVRLNGVALQEPTPLLHGDRLQVAGWDLCFGDESLLGDTVPLVFDPDAPIATPSATASTSRGAGRLISQNDGREYPIERGVLLLGRDPTCDVVLSRPDVSRRHLAIRETPLGYILLDTSTNGVFVNGCRVLTELPLGRGDTIRVGLEEFRFHADRVEASPQQANPQLAATGAFAAARRPVERSAAGKAGPSPVLLGTLEVINAGPTKGTRFELRSPRIDIGRGPHNDVVVSDESVSESHAKFQRREEAWYLSDLGSTNGTYVAGERIQSDVRIASGSELRFGGVKMAFNPAGPTARPSGETRVIVGVKGPDPKRAAERLKELAEHARDEAPDAVASSRGVSLLWIVVLVLVALVLWAVTGAGEP